MNLSRERMAFIRGQVERGESLGREAIEDLLGHNDHLTQLCEARARLLLYAESDIKALHDALVAVVGAAKLESPAYLRSCVRDAEIVLSRNIPLNPA